MGRLQHRLIAAVVVMGVLTAMSVLVADVAAPDDVQESTALPPESRTGGGDGATGLPANQTVPTRVTPPPRS